MALVVGDNLGAYGSLNTVWIRMAHANPSGHRQPTKHKSASCQDLNST